MQCERKDQLILNVSLSNDFSSRLGHLILSSLDENSMDSSTSLFSFLIVSPLRHALALSLPCKMYVDLIGRSCRLLVTVQATCTSR